MFIKKKQHKNESARLVQLALDQMSKGHHSRGAKQFLQGWLIAMEHIGIISLHERSNAERVIYNRTAIYGSEKDKTWWKIS